jgi:hypothetical protein
MMNVRLGVCLLALLVPGACTVVPPRFCSVEGALRHLDLRIDAYDLKGFLGDLVARSSLDITVVDEDEMVMLMMPWSEQRRLRAFCLLAELGTMGIELAPVWREVCEEGRGESLPFGASQRMVRMRAKDLWTGGPFGEHEARVEIDLQAEEGLIELILVRGRDQYVYLFDIFFLGAKFL